MYPGRINAINPLCIFMSYLVAMKAGFAPADNIQHANVWPLPVPRWLTHRDASNAFFATVDILFRKRFPKNRSSVSFARPKLGGCLRACYLTRNLYTRRKTFGGMKIPKWSGLLKCVSNAVSRSQPLNLRKNECHQQSNVEPLKIYLSLIFINTTLS